MSWFSHQYVGVWGSEETYHCRMRVTLWHAYDDIVNLTKVISLTFSPLLIYRGVGTPSRVPCQWSYVPVNENTDYKNMKMLLKYFACYEQSNWRKSVFIIALYIHGTRCPVTRNGVSLDLPRHDIIISKLEQARNIRFHSTLTNRL